MSSVIAINNPFGAPATAEPAEAAVFGSAVARSDAERAIKEVEASMAIAKRFPRDPVAAMDRILLTCTRPTLAEAALYAYPRGSEMVTGPSIRLAEAIAQNWGNIQFGIRELSQANGTSTVEAFAWDVETNVRQTKVFQVAHIRHTRRGQYRLEDPRDIYEMVANQGARRLRSCILGVTPGDVVDAAVRQCEITIQNSADASPEQIEKLVAAFTELGITHDMLVKRLGHHLDAVIAAEVLQLRKIYQSIKDGFAGVGDFFDVEQQAQPSETGASKRGVNGLKSKVTKSKPKREETQPTITYTQVMDKLQRATTRDELNDAVANIDLVPDDVQREELRTAYDERLAMMEGNE
jgi:uncharacterized protein (UPF0262 family)